MLRGTPAVGLALLIVACGGGAEGPATPTPLYPAVAGNYQLSGDFDELPQTIAYIEGTFSIQQASRATGTLTGTSRVTAWMDGEGYLFSYSLSAASIAMDGTLTFQLRESATDVWTFTGQASGGLVIGRHGLTVGGYSNDLIGDFTATRTGGATATRVAPADTVSVNAGASFGRLVERLGR